MLIYDFFVLVSAVIVGVRAPAETVLSEFPHGVRNALHVNVHVALFMRESRTVRSNFAGIVVCCVRLTRGGATMTCERAHIWRLD